jgi:hypothetical protein
MEIAGIQMCLGHVLLLAAKSLLTKEGKYENTR